ncbi:MAG: hypothetical protein JW791_01240 [Nanoarchaeota archaeon]|nr:hypothetical protein [Nanoarchaeota archaeon]
MNANVLDNIRRCLCDLFDEQVSISKISPPKGFECLMVNHVSNEEALEIYFSSIVHKNNEKGLEYLPAEDEHILIHTPSLLVKSQSLKEDESLILPIALNFLRDYMPFTRIYINHYDIDSRFLKSAVWRPESYSLTSDW